MQCEYVFFSDQILVFMIDLKGCILYVNVVFVEISGYVLEELFGQFYNILCYFDVLQEVF